MFRSAEMRSLVVEEPLPERLLANILRQTTWIMTGGSPHFRHGALNELRSNLHLVHRYVRSEHVLQTANILFEMATNVAAHRVSDSGSIQKLRSVLGEFEQAMKVYLTKMKQG
jgi:hypothetical protein